MNNEEPTSDHQPGKIFHPPAQPEHHEAETPAPQPEPSVMSHPLTESKPSQSNQPIAVVNTYTPRGVEYMIMFFALWIAASSLGTLLHAIIDNAAPKSDNSLYDASSSVLPLASIALGVGIVVFAFMFLRLKKAELSDPSIRLDSSRRRAVYLTVLVTFLIGISKIITYVYGLVNSGGDSGGLGGVIFSGFYGGSQATDPGSPLYLWDLLHLVVTLGIAGSIFAYYWRDMHKDDDR